MRILFDLFVRFRSSRELANGGLLVVAGDVVPLDVVVVEVVEHGQADLVLGSVLVVVSVVGLGQLLLGPEIKLGASSNGSPTQSLRLYVFSYLPSSGGPVSLAGLPALAPSRRPVERLARVVQPAAGPVVPLGELRRNVEEVLAGLVAVEGDGPAAVGLAVVVRLVAGELLAALVLEEEGQDVLLAVPEVVGGGVGAPRRLAHVGVLVGERGAGAAAAAHRRRLRGVLDDGELLVVVGRRAGAGDEVGALLLREALSLLLAESGVLLKKVKEPI